MSWCATACTDHPTLHVAIVVIPPRYITRTISNLIARAYLTVTAQSGVIAVSSDYFTTEEYIQGANAEIYVLQLGKTLRCYRKSKDVHFRTWNEWGASTQYEDIPATSEYKNWAKWVSEMFGGLDIFAINILQFEGEGRKPVEYIIDIDDTGCALADQHANEDAAAIIELLLKRVDSRRKELKGYTEFP